jgi:hypothetical protein
MLNSESLMVRTLGTGAEAGMRAFLRLAKAYQSKPPITASPTAVAIQFSKLLDEPLMICEKTDHRAIAAISSAKMSKPIAHPVDRTSADGVGKLTRGPSGRSSHSKFDSWPALSNVLLIVRPTHRHRKLMKHPKHRLGRSVRIKIAAVHQVKTKSETA